jgi:GntR family transcriptional regulator of arabinose operon
MPPRPRQPLADFDLKRELPKHQQVRETLRRHISTMQTGDRLSSDRQMAELFKVDRMIVRRAMLELEAEGFVVRHQGHGTFVKKTTRLGAAADTSKIIGLVVPDVEIPVFARMLKGIDDEARERGFSVLVSNCNRDNQRERGILEQLAGLQLAGIMVFPFHDDSLDPTYHQLLGGLFQRGLPLVLLDQYLPGLDIPSVVTDKVQVGYRAAEHLIMLGHQRICYLTTGHYDVTGQNCLKGHRMALKDYGRNYDPGLTVEIPVRNCAGPAHDAVKRLLTATPNAFTAIATDQFSMTYGILKALDELGMNIPDNMAVIGHDAYQNPQLAHITYTLDPVEELGRAAVRLLLEGAGKESLQRHVLLAPKLVVGTSCGAPRVTGASVRQENPYQERRPDKDKTASETSPFPTVASG